MNCLGIDTYVNKYKEKQGCDHHRVWADGYLRGSRDMVKESHSNIQGMGNICFLRLVGGMLVFKVLF